MAKLERDEQECPLQRSHVCELTAYVLDSWSLCVRLIYTKDLINTHITERENDDTRTRDYDYELQAKKFIVCTNKPNCLLK